MLYIIPTTLFVILTIFQVSPWFTSVGNLVFWIIFYLDIFIAQTKKHFFPFTFSKKLEISLYLKQNTYFCRWNKKNDNEKNNGKYMLVALLQLQKS